MGIVVCLAMLFGLVLLRPAPLNGQYRVDYNHAFRRFVFLALVGLGCWNTIYGVLKITGFWCFMAVISGVAMMLAAGIIARDQSNTSVVRSRFENGVILVLAISFLIYAISLIQLNLGYAILR